MFCKQGNNRILNLSQGSSKSCSGKVCGGWKFVHNGCINEHAYCSGRSGAWLPVVTVCQSLQARVIIATREISNQPSSSSSSSSSSSDPSSSSSLGVKLFDKNSWSSSVPEPYKGYLDQAADRWEQFVRFNPAVVSSVKSFYPEWNGISLEFFSQFSDSVSGVIASCGPTSGIDLMGDAVKFNSLQFEINVNSYYQNYFSPSDWVDIVAHELGHALGIGVFWDPYVTGITGGVAPSNNFLDGNAYDNAQQAYNSITSTTRQKIPLENEGGGGTASAHWEDDYRPSTSPGSMGVGYAGLSNELMVGYYSPGMQSIISDLSIKTLVDFGYEAVAEGFNEGVPILASGVGMVPNLGVKMKCGLHKKVPIVSLNLTAEALKKPTKL